MSRARAIPVESSLLSEVANTVADPLQRDEMAGPSYLHRIPFVRTLFWRRLDAVAQFLKADAARYDSGLDFGCGLGVLLRTLSSVTRQVYATDLVMEPARQLTERLELNNVAFIEPADLRRRLQPGSLDYIVTADVLEHVDDLAATIETFRGTLRVGGQLVVSGPTENILYKGGRVLAGFGGKGHYHHTDIHRIHESISRASNGFQVTGCRVLPIPYVIEAFYVYSYTRVR